jgi:DNA-binding SARP family transcriptional activator
MDGKGNGASVAVVELECRVLGPLEVVRDGSPVRLPPRQRALLALLALRAGESLSCDELLVELWGEEAPARAKASLHNAVSGLRKVLGARVVQTHTAGYRLDAAAIDIDAVRFSSLVAAAESTDEPGERAGLLRDALSCWRGSPLSELGVAWPEVARLEELRLIALEDRIEAELELGAAEELVPELEALVRRRSLRERLWAQLMRALYLAGRQAEALATYRRAHVAFVEKLGIEPGPALKELQVAVLLQDSGLEDREHTPADLLGRAAPLLPVRSSAERAQALLDYGLALGRLGERSHARAVIERAEAEAEQAGNLALSTEARTRLAAHAWLRGELPLSGYVQQTEEAVAAVAPTGNERVLAKLVALHGGALRESGNAADGAAELERAVELSRAAGDAWHEGLCRNHLGLSWVLSPMHAGEALRRCEEQLEALEWGPPGPLGLWAAIGLLHSYLGAESEAESFGTRAVESAREAGLRFELAWALSWLASALEPFDADAAEMQLLRAHDLLAVYSEHEVDLAAIRAELARHAMRRNALEDAESLLQRARERLRADGLHEQVVFHHAAGLLEERKGDVRRAAELIRHAVALARTADDIRRLAGVLETLGRLDPGSNATEEAERLYELKGDVVALRRLRRGDGLDES